MIPVAEPVISKKAKKYLLECLKTSWVSSKGPFVARFEKAFAHFLGAKYAVATSSGTSALHLSLVSLGIGPDDQVIVPALTMIATLLPVLYVGATPVLVDVEKETGNLEIEKAKAAITKRTRAIIVVHLHGHPADMSRLSDLCRKQKIFLIEDAAEAHGAEIKIKNQKSKIKNTNKKTKNEKHKKIIEQSNNITIEQCNNETMRKKSKEKEENYKWIKVGGVGDIGCFSFYANKIITTGEGGMAVTNNRHLAERMRSLRNLARFSPKHFLHKEIGFAYRMSNLQAALGVAQLEEVDKYIEKKTYLATLYNRLLADIKRVCLPVQKDYAKSVYWHYGILLDDRRTRDGLASFLEKHSIETRSFFIPLHRQPAFLKQGLFKGQSYPVAEDLGRRGLCLPSGIAITDKQIRFVSEMIHKFFSS